MDTLGTDLALSEEAHYPPATRVRYFGQYELMGDGQEGGMGVVYQAKQGTALRVVALKMLKSSQLRSPGAIRRFRTEVRAQANLDHPHILPVFEVGEQSGQHYYSMKWVEAGSLGRQMTRGEWRLDHAHPSEKRSRQRAIATLLMQVAQAVAYAHNRGILHRDLKPENILVDADRHPYVADFGLAKFVDPDQADPSATRTQQTVGTPAYASPEQIVGNPDQVGTAADVWSLGVVMYELLAGQRPFSGGSEMDLARKICEVEPKPIRSIESAIDRDLETICLKSLEKDPLRRYSSADALAADLRAWLDGAPILARRTGPVERAVRQVQSHWLASCLVAVAFIGFGLGVWQTRRIHNVTNLAAERARAEMALRQDRDVLAAEEALLRGDTAGGIRSLSALLQMDPTNQVFARRLASALVHRHWPLPLKEFLHDHSVVWAALNPQGDRLLSVVSDPAIGRRVFQARLWDTETGQPRGQPMAHSMPIRSASFDKTSRRILTAAADGSIQVWDAYTGVPAGPTMRHPAPVNHAEFSQDGTRIITASDDKTARVWHAESGISLGPPLAADAPVVFAELSPDGSRAITLSQDNAVILWVAATGERLDLPRSWAPRYAGINLIGHQQELPMGLAWIGSDTGTIRRPRFSCDGERVLFDLLVYRIRDAELQLNDDVAGQQDAEDCRVPAVTATSRDGATELWNLSVRKPPSGQPDNATLTDARAPTRSASGVSTLSATTPATAEQRDVHLRRALTVSGKKVILWDTGDWLPYILFQHETADPAQSASSDHRVPKAQARAGESNNVSGGHDRAGHPSGSGLWQDATGDVTDQLSVLGQIEVSADRSLLATVCHGRDLYLWRLYSGHRIAGPVSHTAEVERVVFTPSGRYLCTADAENTVLVIDTSNGKLVGQIKQPFGAIDEKWLFPRTYLGLDEATLSVVAVLCATQYDDHFEDVLQLSWWDVASGKRQRIERTRLSHAPQQQVAAGDFELQRTNGVSWVTDTPSGMRLPEPESSGGDLHEIALFGDHLVAVSFAREPSQVWLATAPFRILTKISSGIFSDAASEWRRRALPVTEIHGDRLWVHTGQAPDPDSLVLRHDGNIIYVDRPTDQGLVATLTDRNVARVWDLSTGRPITEPLYHPEPIHRVFLLPAGDALFSIGRETVTFWPLPHLRSEAQTLCALVQAALEGIASKMEPTRGDPNADLNAPQLDPLLSWLASPRAERPVAPR